MASRTIRVYSVVADTDGINPQTGDHMKTFRFRDRAEADRFAASATCWGSPATVESDDAPIRLARRWGLV